MWIFGFKSVKIEGNKKGTIIILIDGLSFDALQYSIKKGFSPYLKKLCDGEYKLKSYYCGLPAATTSTEALLFYGNKKNIPGFTWYDRTLNTFVRGNRSLELTQFEDSYKKKRNLMENGSTIMAVYSGGASELSMSGRNLTFSKSLYLLQSVHYFLMAFLYPVQLIRTLYLTLKTIVLYRKANRHSALETFSKIVLGQFSCFLTEIEIMRNTEKIFVDFLLYDEYAHEYGPTHSTTLSTLRLVDRYIKRIMHSTKYTNREYELILLSDHGQTESIPFDYPTVHSTLNITKVLDNASYTVLKTYGGFIPTNKKRELYIVPAGSTLQLYFSDFLAKGAFEQELNIRFPHFITRLLTLEEFGWILVRKSENITTLYGKSGSITFHSAKSYEIVGVPFPDLVLNEIEKLIVSFQEYATFKNNGDLVLFGSVTKQNKIYSFEKHKGTHGGFYGPMTHPFIMTKNPDFTGDSMKSLFDTIALHI